MEAQLRTGQAARVLEVSEPYVRRLVKQGKLRGTPTPLGLLFEREEVERVKREVIGRRRERETPVGVA